MLDRIQSKHEHGNHIIATQWASACMARAAAREHAAACKCTQASPRMSTHTHKHKS